ncbi:MAG: ABC transporter substrate-binding protein [Sulfuriferula sp.]|nr:ABC transporter substrate-binding protein [Sulfuriferula sp.]
MPIPVYYCRYNTARQIAATLLLIAAALLSGPAAAREITDMAGRKIDIPDSIERPLGAQPPITALLYILAPDMVHALNMPFTPGSESFLRPGTENLPIIGSAMGHGRQINPETLLALKPDVAFAWKNAFSDLDPSGIEAPFRKTGIPVVYIKLDTLADWPPALEYVGRLLGREARAKMLADYIRQAMSKVQKATAGIPPSRQVTVYYAETPDGLSTDCNTSFHSEPIALAGGDNVYHCTLKTMMGQERIDMERILMWNPQVIVVQDQMFFDNVALDQRWSRVEAVKSGRLLNVPRKPMNWLDRPPSFTRALGIQWLAHELYPDRFRIDMRAETRNFYRLFFGVELSDVQLTDLLNTHRP